jgi:Domain of unknown function (DUF4160)
MPEISRFFGLVIKIYFNDHAPPHFHVEHGEHEAVIAIQTLEVLRGKLSSRAHVMVLEWASMHRHELMQDWNRAQAGKPLRKIAPLV